MKPSDALEIALRTRDPNAFELAERMAYLEIGPYAAALVKGLRAHVLQNTRRRRRRSPPGTYCQRTTIAISPTCHCLHCRLEGRTP
jgi:hypothetical protein